MIEVEETGDGLRAVDVAKNEVTLEIDGWEPGGEELEIDRRVHETVTGRVEEVRLPAVGMFIENKDASKWEYVANCDSRSFSPGKFLIQSNCPVTTFLQIESEFHLQQDIKNDRSTLSFPNRIQATIGFRSLVKRPYDQIRIPPTPGGVASALSLFGDYHETSTPDRSYPTMRPYPPLLSIHEDVEPPSHSRSRDNNSIRVEVPSSFKDLFTIAPLVFYLGATVTAEDVDRASISADDHQFLQPKGVSLSEWSASLLKRTFYLDCLVRNAGPYGVDLSELSLLETLQFDTDELYSLPIASRFSTYLHTQIGDVLDHFPEWPLAVYVNPSRTNIQALPHLLNNLAMIHPPRSTVLDNHQLVTRSLEAFQRVRGVFTDTSIDRSPRVHQPKPVQSERYGWLAPGIVTEGFKATPESYANGLAERKHSPGEINIAIVLNDNSMKMEQSKVLETYQRREDELPVSAETFRDMSVRELRDVFGAHFDFLHYIGHCDEEGFRCTDGHFSAGQISETGVRLFFLNACGSYQEGLSLVRKGAAAGAVTTSDVIDAQARNVGVALARLLMFGFSLEKAVDLAKQRSIMNQRYALLGDGLQTLIQGRSTVPAILVVNPISEDSYSISYELDRVDFHGGIYKAYTSSSTVLAGNPDETVISRSELPEVLDRVEEPLLFDGELRWPDEFLEELF